MAFAVMQIGGPVYGVGETLDEALNDAQEWLDDSTDVNDIDHITKIGGAVAGAMVWAECTHELMRIVRDVGGDVNWDTDENDVAYFLPQYM